MLPILAASLAIFVAHVNAHPHDPPILTLATRQSNASSTDCNTTCSTQTDVINSCNVPHCGCAVSFLQAQGECLLCQANTPEDAAAVQFLLNAEMTQCRSEGIPVTYQLQLPPAAADIVGNYNTELKQQQIAFLALQIGGGHLGLVIVLLFGLFSRKIHRDLTFYNFCITWIFSSIAFSILLYNGIGEGNTPISALGEVSPKKCLAQAALTNGVQVMTAGSTMALVIQLWLHLRAAIRMQATHGTQRNRWTTIALLVTPYILFLIFMLPSLLIGRQAIAGQAGPFSFQRALPTKFYCIVVELHILLAVYGLTLGIMVITVIFDVLIINILYRHWKAFRTVRNQSPISLSILVRVIIFSTFRIVVAIAYGTVLKNPPFLQNIESVVVVNLGGAIWADILQAAIPLVGFLVLGVNSDMINILFFWRKKRHTNSSVKDTWNEKNTLETSGS